MAAPSASNLLFGLPLWLGALLTVFLEVFLIVSQRYHRIETIIVGFLGIIGLCYLAEIVIVKPDWAMVAPAIVVPELDRRQASTSPWPSSARW